MWLGAWILTLVILGIVVISTGLPDENHADDNEIIVIWLIKLMYLGVLATTFYSLGERFSNI